jgi:hypothetical protein
MNDTTRGTTIHLQNDGKNDENVTFIRQGLTKFTG